MLDVAQNHVRHGIAVPATPQPGSAERIRGAQTILTARSRIIARIIGGNRMKITRRDLLRHTSQVAAGLVAVVPATRDLFREVTSNPIRQPLPQPLQPPDPRRRIWNHIEGVIVVVERSEFRLRTTSDDPRGELVVHFNRTTPVWRAGFQPYHQWRGDAFQAGDRIVGWADLLSGSGVRARWLYVNLVNIEGPVVAVTTMGDQLQVQIRLVKTFPRISGDRTVIIDHRTVIGTTESDKYLPGHLVINAGDTVQVVGMENADGTISARRVFV